MPSVRTVRRRRKTRVPARRVAEKMAIWERHANPVGFKLYGRYLIDGEPKHYEVSVIVERRMNRKAMYHGVREFYIRTVKQSRLPAKHYYVAYDGFMELFSSEWIEVDEVLNCEIRHTAT